MVDYRMDGVRKRSHFKSKAIAKKFLREIEDMLEMKKAGLKHIEPISLASFVSLFIENHFKTKSASYLESEKKRFNPILRFFGADMLLTDITKSDIVAYRNHRQDNGRANKTIKNELGLLHKFFQKAIDNDFAYENPCDGVEQPRNIPRNIRDAWTDEEFKFAMRHLDSEMQKAVLIMINTGMRKGELFNLQKSDLDFEHGVLKVRSEEGATTKNYSSRIVPIPDILIRLLRDAPDGPIMRIHIRAFDSRFRDFKKATGFPRILHELRHTYISKMQKAGIDKKTTQSWVGQKTPGVIERYTHLLPESNETWRRMVNKGVNVGMEFVNQPAGIVELGHHLGTKLPEKEKTHENNLSSHGLQNENGGAGGSRTHVRRYSLYAVYKLSYRMSLTGE